MPAFDCTGWTAVKNLVKYNQKNTANYLYEWDARLTLGITLKLAYLAVISALAMFLARIMTEFSSHLHIQAMARDKCILLWET